LHLHEHVMREVLQVAGRDAEATKGVPHLGGMRDEELSQASAWVRRWCVRLILRHQGGLVAAAHGRHQKRTTASIPREPAITGAVPWG
jgi:hypothetical protein